MSEKRRTFPDPQTGEEIESTGLARWGAGLAFGAVFGLVFGLLVGFPGLLLGPMGMFGILVNALAFGLFGALVYGLRQRWGRRFRFGVLFGVILGGLGGLAMLVTGLVSSFTKPGPLFLVCLIGGLFSGLIYGLLAGLGARVAYPITQRVHDGIARQQHRNRQKLLRQQEFPHVPDGALSRVLPPQSPEATSSSLSQADPPEETSNRLADVVGEEAQKQETPQEVRR